jgi:hypothetical protein
MRKGSRQQAVEDVNMRCLFCLKHPLLGKSIYIFTKEEGQGA